MDTHHHQHQRKNHERSSSSSNNNNNKSGMIVTEEELAHHVSSMYIRGPGGIFNEMAKKRERNKGTMVARKQHGSTSTLVDGGNVGDVGFDDEYEEYLRKLDRHPALVLNADFQVCILLSFLLFFCLSGSRQHPIILLNKQLNHIMSIFHASSCSHSASYHCPSGLGRKPSKLFFQERYRL
jgi:hypothetical protein